MLVLSKVSIVLPVYLISFIIVQTFIPGFPKEILLIQAGSSFGIIGGGIINWIGMVIGAQIAYEIIRFATERSEKVIEQMKKLENHKYVVRIRVGGNPALFVIRLIPYAPNDVLSMMSGFFKLPRIGYMLISIVTAVPYAFVFAYLGYLGAEFIQEPALLLQINIALTLSFTLFGLLYIGVKRYRDHEG